MAKHTRMGSSEPIQIYQDSFFDHSAPMISHAPMPPAPKAPSRRPLQPNNCNVVFNTPNNFAVMKQSQSPFKAPGYQTAAPLVPLKASEAGRLKNVTIGLPNAQTQPSTDSIPKKQPLMSRFKTVAQKPLMAANAGGVYTGKENNHPIIYPGPPGLNLSMETFYQKPTGKRLLDAPPIKDTRPQKKQKLEERLEESPLPPHDSFPPIVDDGTKPGHSYAMLIGMAILRSPQRRLTLSQIYKWISDNFSFYHPNDAGWQNSIRHNLSLNKNFVKHERPKDDPGKGNYWAIEPGMEHQFLKEKNTRKSMSVSENLPVMSTTFEPSLPVAPMVKQEVSLPPPLPSSQPTLPSMPVPGSKRSIPLEPEPSSDATILVSDNATIEDHLAPKPAEPDPDPDSEPVLDSSGYSPLPAAMHSSPPIPRHIQNHGNTPPPVSRRRGSSSAAKSHKRKIASMDDSGYISSLESSVLRSNHNSRLLTSEADRPRIKRGRAEEEIARLRASSYDSPSKGRSWNGFVPQSSSPLRHGSQNDSNQMLPPLTPAVKLQPPPRPPPSVSPNTNLRLHRAKVRDMVESPLRRTMVDIPEEENPWETPIGFNFDQSVYNFDLGIEVGDMNPGFDIFQDTSMPSLFPPVENCSPVKRSAKRPRLERQLSASVLGDITNSSSRRSVTSAPFLKASRSPAVGLDTPSKVFIGLNSSPSKQFAQSPSKSRPETLDVENSWLQLDDFCSNEFLDETNDFAGVDITQGFDRIGQSIRNPRPTPKPGLGRSYSTTF